MKWSSKEALHLWRAKMAKLHMVDNLWSFVIEAEGINFSCELNNRFCDLYNRLKEEADAYFEANCAIVR